MMETKNKNKTHLDCEFLFKKMDGAYCCYDVRSPFFRKSLTPQEAMKEACKYFHQKKDKNLGTPIV